MADIISLDDRRKKPAAQPTIREIADDCTEDILGNWEKFARNNSLNDYFIQCTPSWSQPSINYVSDLNALSAIETKIDINLAIFGPGHLEGQLGWMAGFKINDHLITTPGIMLSEAYARCFNILLFLKLCRTMTQLNMTIV